LTKVDTFQKRDFLEAVERLLRLQRSKKDVSVSFHGSFNGGNPSFGS